MIEKQKKIVDEFHSSEQSNIVSFLSFTRRLIDHFIDQFISSEGFNDIRPGHRIVLMNIPAIGCNINHLSNNAFITKQAMSQLSKDLDKAGYLKITTSNRDKRERLVELTTKGVNYIQTMNRANAQLEEFIGSILGKEGFTSFSASCEKLVSELPFKLMNKLDLSTKM